jgi:hypothetical protein
VLKYRPVTLFLGLALLAGACNLPASTRPDATVEISHTQSAQTLVVQLTQIAQPGTPLPAPGQTQAAQSTATAPTLAPSASETPQPSATATATTTLTPGPTTAVPATALPTLGSNDPRSALGDPDWSDTFRTGENWYLYEDDYARFTVENHQLSMVALRTGPRNSWMLSYPTPDNYYIEMTATTSPCAGKDRYGFILRTDVTSGYWFMFSCDGMYTVVAWDGANEEAVKLVDWTPSGYIQPGGEKTNRLGVSVKGAEFKLYANGNLLDEVKDDTYEEGSFGVIIGAQKTQGFTVQVSEVSYWRLR